MSLTSSAFTAGGQYTATRAWELESQLLLLLFLRPDDIWLLSVGQRLYGPKTTAASPQAAARPQNCVQNSRRK